MMSRNENKSSFSHGLDNDVHEVVMPLVTLDDERANPRNPIEGEGKIDSESSALMMGWRERAAPSGSYTWNDAASLSLEGRIFSSASQALGWILQEENKKSSSKRSRDRSPTRSFSFSDTIEIEDALADELFTKLSTTDIRTCSTNDAVSSGASTKKRKRNFPLRRIEKCSEISRQRSFSSV
jgi:hypothetical protein